MTRWFVSFLLLFFFVGCARSASSPELLSWEEQFASAKEAASSLGEFVLIDADAFPADSEPRAANATTALKVTLVFQSLTPAEGATEYASQVVAYNDHDLSGTLDVAEMLARPNEPDAVAVARAAMLRIGPQDALQATLQEGEAYAERPVDRGNVSIHLVWDVAVEYPELKDTAVPAWRVIYYRGENELHLLVNAQTGEVLGRYEK